MLNRRLLVNTFGGDVPEIIGDYDVLLGFTASSYQYKLQNVEVLLLQNGIIRFTAKIGWLALNEFSSLDEIIYTEFNKAIPYDYRYRVIVPKGTLDPGKPVSVSISPIQERIFFTPNKTAFVFTKGEQKEIIDVTVTGLSNPPNLPNIINYGDTEGYHYKTQTFTIGNNVYNVVASVQQVDYDGTISSPHRMVIAVTPGKQYTIGWLEGNGRVGVADSQNRFWVDVEAPRGNLTYPKLKTYANCFASNATQSLVPDCICL